MSPVLSIFPQFPSFVAAMNGKTLKSHQIATLEGIVDGNQRSESTGLRAGKPLPTTEIDAFFRVRPHKLT